MNYDLTLTFFGLILIIIIDSTYLYFNKKFYSPMLEEKNINFIYAIFSWLIIIIAIQLLVLSRPDLNNENLITYSLILGFCMYGLFNFTNAAIFPSQRNNFIIIGDICWGMILTTVISFCLFKIKNVMLI
jgi:uncharacterized membrane protein